MSGPGTGYLGGWTSRDEERKTTSKEGKGYYNDLRVKDLRLVDGRILVDWYDGETTKLKDITFLWKRTLLVEHILKIRDSEEIDVLYEKIIGDE